MIGAARRHVLRRRLTTAALWVFCILLACFVLLLLAGVDVLGWAWLWGVGIASGTFAFIQVKRKLPDAYATAQELDRRFDLNDTLATAWYVRQRGLDTPSARFLQSSAGQIAARVDATSAFPARRRRPFVVAACLSATVFALLFARYRTTGQLDLHPSCVTLWLTPLAGTSTEQPPSQPRTTAKNLLSRQLARGHAGADVAEHPESDAESNDGTASGKSRSMLQRLRDALSKLLNSPSQDGESASKEDREASASAERNAGSEGDGKKGGAPGQGEKPSQPADSKQQNGAGQGGEPGSTEQARQQDGGMSQNPGDKSAGNGNSQQSGAGSDNGSKRIANAAELKTIGKIEELMGKRAAEVTGEMSLVKASGPQQLATPFNEHEAFHGPADSTLDNQPIPEEDREFVRKYMDELHRVTDSQPAK